MILLHMYDSDMHLSMSDMLPRPPRVAQPPRPRSQLRACHRQHPGWRPRSNRKMEMFKESLDIEYRYAYILDILYIYILYRYIHWI